MNPLVVQSDHTLMLEVEHPQYKEARDFLGPFSELVKSPEFIHTYRITPLSLWNAAALEIPLAEILDGMNRFSRYTIPSNVIADIREWYSIYGKLVLVKDSPGQLRLEVKDSLILERIIHDDRLKPYWLERNEDSLFIRTEERGSVKQALIKAGYPVKDICGYISGDPLEIVLRETDLDNNPFGLRDYQTDAVEAFYHAGSETGGSGIIVLPCGSGKTIIGLGVIARVSSRVLIVGANNVSVCQWRDEIISKTSIKAEQVGEYTGMAKEIKPVTITTYQMLTYRKNKSDTMRNLEIFTRQNWGLIIYDEVHLLPAPVFRATTGIQARRRLGLTATLVREDGREDDVFALIGPKRYDVPWKVLENRGYIAEAYCTEYRLSMPDEVELRYAHAGKRERFRIAAENPHKLEMVRELISNHTEDNILVIGQYISQLEEIARSLQLILITGKTKHSDRRRLYDDFKAGRIKVLVVSKVANFAVDLPDANILIQVSGAFGSRQEEAQRLGRILRPKKRRSLFYTLVSKGTDEQAFGIKRQLFLVEQGYKYHIRYAV